MRTSPVALLLMGVAACTTSCATHEYQAAESGQAATGSLEAAMAAARQQAPEAEARRIWAGKEADASGAPSPDGTLLSYTDWTTLSLGVRDLRTGENRILVRGTDPSGLGGFPETSAFSSDGKRLAYRWIDKQGYDLRVIDVAGSEPRIVVPKSADIASIQPREWTADDREILVGIHRPDRTIQVGFANVATGELRVIRTFSWSDAVNASAALSRDGRYLALSVPSGKAPTAESDVVILTLDGSREVGRIVTPGVERIVGWAADGRLFYQSAPGGAGPGAAWPLFAVQMRDGKPAGSPQLVKSDMSRVLYTRLTSDGRLFYGILSGSYDVYVAGIDVASARVLSPAARASHRLVGFNQGIDWTADGRYAAYLVREGGAPRSPGVLTIRDQETGDARELRPDLEYINPAIRWSPDARKILVQGTDSKGRHGLYTIDAHSGEITSIVYGSPKGGVIHRPQWAPDGRSIYYAVFEPGQDFRIVHRKLESGAEREVFTREKLSAVFAVSDDGATLAVMQSDKDGIVISLVPAAGAQPRELLRLGSAERVSSITWSRDGKYVLFSKLDPTVRTGELWRVPVDGGTAQPVGLEMKNMTGLRMHPDGRRIGFTGGEAEFEVWVMDAAKPAASRARAGGSGR